MQVSNKVSFCMRDIKHIANEHTKIMKKHIDQLTDLSDEEHEFLIEQAAEQYKAHMFEE